MWYKKAAELGVDEAQYRLALMYGKKYQWQKRLDWMQKAAEAGHKEAQFVLGGLYDSGSNMATDLYLAKYWYNKACGNVVDGIIEACEKYQNLLFWHPELADED